jgi:hypothetical protein
MLVAVEDIKSKRAAQKVMKQALTSALQSQGRRNIGFPGGNGDEVIYSNGNNQLWCAFRKQNDAKTPKYWNAFGVFDSGRPSQEITVEINFPTVSNSARIAGFFSRDPETGRTYIMHDGSVGGGRPGIGRDAFLAWSKLSLTPVVQSDGRERYGVIVGDVTTQDLPSRLWRFVKIIRQFKDAVSLGELDDEEVRRQIAEWGAFNSESSGRRQGTRNAQIDYVSYHGDVVERLYEERTSRRTHGEEVLNSRLIDLYVRSKEAVTEVYEVKTSLGRQSLYAAIGQLLTHSVEAGQSVKRVLVVPDGPIAGDLLRCMAVHGINIRRFTLTRGKEPQVVLSPEEELSTG